MLSPAEQIAAWWIAAMRWSVANMTAALPEIPYPYFDETEET